MPTGLTETIVAWRSKDVSNEKIRPSSTSNKSLKNFKSLKLK